MKKILLTLLAAAGLSASANAQLADGSVFPDFTTVDYLGNPINLYSILNSGKTVFIDVSATWCGPCWSYHTTKALDKIWNLHGPAGKPGVSTSTTDDAYVIWVQGESAAGLPELTFNYGLGAGFGRAQNTAFNHTTFTQGDWTTGVNYPIINDSSLQAARNSAWKIGYFPTVYMICRDHLVYELNQPSEPTAYAALLAGCPTYAPSTTVDAKATAYTGTNSFNCKATPTVSFQNYSTGTLTTATITVMDGGGTTVHTEPWTGSLAPYAIANVTLGSFTGTTFSGYKFSVNAGGDTYTANNTSQDSIFKVFSAANAASVPMTEDFEASTNFFRYYLPDPKGLTSLTTQLNDPGGSSTPKDVIGKSGSKTYAVMFNGYDATYSTTPSLNYQTSFFFGNYNISANTNLTFDLAYSAKTGITNTDKLDVLVSTDCGDSWTSAWSASGTALATTTPTPSKWYVPATSTDWKNKSVNLGAAYKNTNLMIKFAGTTAPVASTGQLLYVDNIGFKVVAAVSEVLSSNDITIYPNPAKDNATINLTLNSSATVTVQMFDMVGRMINTVDKNLNAGNQNIKLSTASVAAGLYTVKISADGITTSRTLSVIK